MYKNRNRCLCCILCFFAIIIVSIVVLKTAESLMGTCRFILQYLYPDILVWTNHGYIIYYSFWVITIIILSFLICYLIRRHFLVEIIVRNSSYIEKILSSQGQKARLFVTSKMELVKQLAGEGLSKDEIWSLSTIIDNGINPIMKFLSKETVNSTLLIDSKWGSGKTTAVLIAINELKDDKAKFTNRYIYESAFRYNNSVSEFVKDILDTLSNTLFELGINIRNDVDGLVQNFDFEPSKMITNILQTNPASKRLTIELAHKINEAYNRKKLKNIVFIIIDDLDRVQGDDILEVISLLSLLRHLNFVKIIIPADLGVIVESLKSIKIPEPELFVKKYLPEQFSVKTNFGYDAAESAAMAAMKELLPDGACPIWAAVLIAMISETLRNETSHLSNHVGIWLPETYSGKAEEVGWTARRILRSAPNYMISQSNGQLRRGDYSGGNYYWDSKYNSIRNFENILWGVYFTKNRKPIHDNFSANEYEILVEPWIFEYAQAHWEEFGLTIRMALDYLQMLKADASKIPKNPEAQFVFAFNKFFPKKNIKLATEGVQPTGRNL